MISRPPLQRRNLTCFIFTHVQVATAGTYYHESQKGAAREHLQELERQHDAAAQALSRRTNSSNYTSVNVAPAKQQCAVTYTPPPPPPPATASNGRQPRFAGVTETGVPPHPPPPSARFVQHRAALEIAFPGMGLGPPRPRAPQAGEGTVTGIARTGARHCQPNHHDADGTFGTYSSPPGNFGHFS